MDGLIVVGVMRFSATTSRYDAKRCLNARAAAVLSRSSRAILSGASVSPAVYGIMKGHRDDDEALACPFCQILDWHA